MIASHTAWEIGYCLDDILPAAHSCSISESLWRSGYQVNVAALLRETAKV